jgi:hypothetical protein
MEESIKVPLDRSVASDGVGHNTPVTSYLPSGVHDNPLPMGKYYPSNYEKTMDQSRQENQGSLHRSASSKQPSQGPSRQHSSASTHNTEVDLKRRLQQYQRDMITQATLAASEVMGGQARAGSTTAAGLKLNELPMKTVPFGAQFVQKPTSPRLYPLGSPGPVTPMDLESEGTSYLDRGRGKTVCS